jgi:phosphoglycerol transferase
MLTADTHFIDGYMDGSCSKPFLNKYANSFHCSDSKIYQFVEWIKQQDFYKDTTIVIVGDHLTMQSDFYDIDPSSSRYIFNTFINSAITTSNTKNRLLSHFDIYPTTLAAMGATIEGNKLALGVNLFSNETTLIEKLGIDESNEKLSNKSNYYNEYLLGDSYQEMLDKLEEEEKQANIEKCGKEVCDEIEGELEMDSNSENIVEDKDA